MTLSPARLGVDIGDINTPAACNEVGHGRLAGMTDEFGSPDLVAVAGFMVDTSRRAGVLTFSAAGAGYGPVAEHIATVEEVGRRGEPV
ncbi:hypothetical protein BOO69_08825 [Sulfitobacter alexandrii]|uniref:Uncharacterized protein n=1 Tax=Sulfitobacter alexandrii TaxID=1917485 RepID=A0A1J0WGP3_9RHOB|nr:hypothetical protein [Sulfitobacter alexandrii]APE43501.1 hypothetical protein BOO69_08825 [Sulfitobacter alexandrii]